jgi:BNR repeat-like domain
MVTTFQVGRIFGGGSVAIGFATSTNGGATWTSGFLAGLTSAFQNGPVPNASDPVVAYDARHGQWIISTLPIGTSPRIAVSRSRDGISWDPPILVSQTPDADKNWIACDNNSSSPHFGNCYMQWDDPSTGGLIWMTTSSDGGATWSPEINTADRATGIGGQPVVQPNGTVIVPISNQPTRANPGFFQRVFRSTDGGATWTTTTNISNITDHAPAGGLRSEALLSALADSTGKVYAVWSDCRFRTGCTSNDIVMSTSTDGVSWTTPVRIPLDPTSSTVDHFLPALGIDSATGGGTAHLALLYYFYPNTACAVDTCSLNVGLTTSQDGGATWATPTTLVSGILLNSLPSTSSGLMVGDYFAAVFSAGRVFPVFALANLKSGATFDQAIYTTTSGLLTTNASSVSISTREKVENLMSDRAPRSHYDLEGRYPVHPLKRD